MGFEVCRLRERLGANVALEGPKATVRVGVALQLRWRDEGLATFLAFVAESTAVNPSSALAASTAVKEAIAASEHLCIIEVNEVSKAVKTKAAPQNNIFCTQYL